MNIPSLKASIDAFSHDFRGVHDLNFDLFICDTFGLIRSGINHEQWEDSFCSSYGVHTLEDLQQNRRSAQRRRRSTNSFLCRYLPSHGFCSTDLARFFARYRGLSCCKSSQALSHGYQEHPLQIHLVGCFELSRLAHLSRSGDALDCSSKRALLQRTSAYGFGRDCLCLGLDNHRSLFELVRLGAVSPSQSSREDAYTFGSAGQHTCVYPYQRREDARRQRDGHHARRGRLLLYYGQRVCGLHQAVQAPSDRSLLRYSRQRQHECSTGLLRSCGQRQWNHVRSNGQIERALRDSKLPRTPSSNSAQRYRDWKDADIFDQQYDASALDDCSALQKPLASRIVFQVDKAASKNKTFCGYKRERSQDSNLVRSLNLCPHSNHKKGITH